MRSWARKITHRDRTGRNGPVVQSRWTDSEARVTDVLSSNAPSGLTTIESESTDDFPSKLSSNELPILSRIGSASTPNVESRKCFWRDAFQILQNDENNQRLLGIYQKALLDDPATAQPNYEKAPDHLSRLIDHNLKLIDGQHWKVRVGDLTVEVRTALNNVARAAQYAQSFVSTVASGEPYAAMAWAGVSLFLPVSSYTSSCQFIVSINNLP